jgi:hypothetical protein
MKTHQQELRLAQAHSQTVHFEGLTPLQMRNIRGRGRGLHLWFAEHPRTHTLINLAVITFVLLADWAALLWLPRQLLTPESHGWGRVLSGSLLIGSLHGWLLYSLSAFSIHEGAAHRLIFPPKWGRSSRLLNGFANNLCRIAGAEPINYVRSHQAHHAKFGTEQDGEFLNYVKPGRFWRSLLPWGVFFNYTDFIVHRPLARTPSYLLSLLIHLGYAALYGALMWPRFGLVFTLLTLLVVMPHFAFYLDRLRQFTEHNLMPLDNQDGARSFGLGFWGMLIGGGPWGQPCHWMHHLAPQLPWYQQLVLHRYVRRQLTPTQRRQFLLAPVSGFPQLCWRLWRQMENRVEDQGNKRIFSVRSESGGGNVPEPG